MWTTFADKGVRDALLLGSHLNGQCHLDEDGQDFRTVEEARHYVITCGRVCVSYGPPRERAILAHCIIEITDREALSDVVMMAHFALSQSWEQLKAQSVHAPSRL